MMLVPSFNTPCRVQIMPQEGVEPSRLTTTTSKAAASTVSPPGQDGLLTRYSRAKSMDRLLFCQGRLSPSALGTESVLHMGSLTVPAFSLSTTMPTNKVSAPKGLETPGLMLNPTLSVPNEAAAHESLGPVTR